MALAKFNNYNEEGRSDNGYEALQDFFLSWTLRCSPINCKDENPKVQEYARRIVYTLIYGHNNNDAFAVNEEAPATFQVISVTTKRQLSHIDLLAEVKTNENGIEKKYVLNIENKWYTDLSEGQLCKYNVFVQNHFNDGEKVNLFITCDTIRNNYEWEKEECRRNNYKYLTIDEIISIAKISEGERTNNALFDAYWFDL